jgi:hypothetical protein
LKRREPGPRFKDLNQPRHEAPLEALLQPTTGGVVTTSRKLEEMSSDLDDMSITLDEIKDEVETETGETGDIKKLDEVQSEIEKASDLIDDSLSPEPPEK